MAKVLLKKPVLIPISMDRAKLRAAQLKIRAVNHHLRKSMLDLLEENDAMTVTDIYQGLGLEQSVASQHLAILRRAGVVKTDRSGKFINYSIDEEGYNRIKQFVIQLTKV